MTIQFEIHDSSSYTQPYYWRIVASNGEVLAHSENLSSKAACTNAINVVKRDAATAPVIDKTRAGARR